MIKMMPLKQVCSGIIDCPHESPEWLSKGIPVIRNFNLVDGQIDMSDASYVDESTYTKRTRRAVPSAGDIIFSREAPIGNCAIVPADFKCCLGQRLVLLRVNREICSPEYLLAALLSDFVKTQIFQVEKSGSIVSNFNISDLGDLIIPIIDRQESVASVSDTLNKKLLINKNICAELESMAKTLYDYWFTQFDFPDENGKPYRSSGGEMVWNDQLKREIPKGWKVVPITDGYDVCYGFPFDTNYFVDDDSAQPVVRIRDILDRSISAYTTEKVDKRYWLQSGDMIIGMDGNFHINFWDNTRALLNQRCVRVRSTGKLPVFMAYFASLPYIKAREKNVSRTTVGHLSADDIKSLYVFLPDETTLNSAKAIFNVAIEKICRANDEKRELTKLRDWLLPMLMNGQAIVE